MILTAAFIFACVRPAGRRRCRAARAGRPGAPPQLRRLGRAVIAIPLTLTLARVALGPPALWAAHRGLPREFFAGVLLTDDYDGVLARRLGVARHWLRRLDSAADVAFYLFVLGAAAVLERETLRAAGPALALLLASEALCLGASLRKFGRPPATHCTSAKLYGLALFLAFSGVLCLGWGPWALWAACACGLPANAEVLVIVHLSTRPPVDVPSVAWLRRRPFDGPAAAGPGGVRSLSPASHDRAAGPTAATSR